MKKSLFKNDKYKKARGGYSRLLNIACQECGLPVAAYQKDGAGNLRRMYIDRIIEPKVSISGISLLCPKSHLLGVKIIYKKENRPAFRLFVDSVVKKQIKSR
ncbi:hypothetical protein BH11PAT3_BH11PAT3_0820 [soil metagenome]